MTIYGFDSKEKVYLYLKSHAVSVLSTTSSEGEIHAAPIYYLVDPNLNFFFFSKSDTKKAKNLEKNNHAAITIVDPMLPITVQSRGTVEHVIDPQIYKGIFNTMLQEEAEEKNGLYWPPPISKIYSMGELLLYKYTPNWLRFADFSESKNVIELSKNVFSQIIPSP